MPLTYVELAEKARSTHGQIAHNAALADSCLYEVLHHFAGCTRDVTRAIYFTFDAVSGRISLVRRVASVKGADADTLRLLQELSNAIKDATTHRNQLAHSFLILSRDIFGDDDHIQVVNPKRSTPGGERVTEQTLLDAIGVSESHLEKVQKAFEALCLRLGIQPRVRI